MTWEIVLPRTGRNRTYYVHAIIQFRNNLRTFEECHSAETCYEYLCGSNMKFQTAVQLIRNWTEGIQSVYGRRFSCAPQLLKNCHWAHHDKKQFPNRHTNVSIAHMEETLALMYQIFNEIQQNHNDDNDEEDDDDDDEVNMLAQTFAASFSVSSNSIHCSICNEQFHRGRYRGRDENYRCSNCRG